MADLDRKAGPFNRLNLAHIAVAHWRSAARTGLHNITGHQASEDLAGTNFPWWKSDHLKLNVGSTCDNTGEENAHPHVGGVPDCFDAVFAVARDFITLMRERQRNLR